MTDRYPKAAGKTCLHPGELYNSLMSLGLPTDFWGRANSIRCPVGMEPGSAWFIVSRTDGNTIAGSKNSFVNLTWTDGSTTTTFQKYVLHRAILCGLDGDSKAPYLLEFRDKRQVFKDKTAIDKEYNVRRTTRQGDNGTTNLFYDNSRNSGSDWTWQTMADNIWGNFPSAIRGTSPTLAYTPASGPENFRFHGSAWDAYSAIMEAMQSVLCYNPIADSFTVQRIGATQSGLSSSQSTLQSANRRIFTDTPLSDINLSVCPEKIRFYFPKRLELEYSLFDTAANTHLANPYYTVDKTTSLTGAQAGTVMPYRTNYIAEIDSDGSTVNNSSTLDTLAGELRDKIVNRIDKGTERGLTIYSGIATTVLPGCEIGEVVWRDYGDDGGCVTEATRNPRLGYPVDAPQIQLQPFTGEVLVKNSTGSSITAGSSGTVRIQKGSAGSEADTSDVLTVSAYNRSSVDLKNGKLGAVALMNGNVYVVPLQT